MTVPPRPGPGQAVPSRPGPGQAVPPGVLQALDRLAALDGAPVSEHVAAFDRVHRLLQDALATLDEV